MPRNEPKETAVNADGKGAVSLCSVAAKAWRSRAVRAEDADRDLAEELCARAWSWWGVATQAQLAHVQHCNAALVTL